MGKQENSSEETNTLLDTLYQQVSSRCYITSKDNLIKERLEKIIKNALISVKSLLGIPEESFDFSKDGKENELFLNYCMYRWNNRTTKEFENNYMSDILSVRNENEVKYYRSLKEENNE